MARASKDYVGTWEGGFIRRESNGRPVYIIRRKINGTRYKFSTHCHSLRAAIEQLKKFEADPDAYNPAGDPNKQPVLMTVDLVEEFLVWSRDVKKNSREWLVKQKNMLAWWAEKLEGLDLRSGPGARRVSLVEHVLPALKDASVTNHRKAVLKAFYGWLRKEKHLVAIGEDPTFQALTVETARPAQWKKSKVIPKTDYQAARAHLAAHWRDAMDIQAATGWHVSEVTRFASSGRVEKYRGTAAGVGGVLVCPQTKNGEELRTAVSKLGLDAGKRLLARGSLGREKYSLAVGAACRAAGITPFAPGQFRHSVATWAIQRGADPAQVAAFLNHKSPQTTKRFYATHAVPKKVPTLA